MTREEAVNKMMKESFLGYESPIQTILSDMRVEYEENMVRAVQNVGFCVNKEELIKALHYDRGQYEKGYADAKKLFERPHGEWENCGGIFCARCSVCKEVAYETAGNFCPNCGADMRNKKDDLAEIIEAVQSVKGSEET